jgi:hypothetical protein
VTAKHRRSQPPPWGQAAPTLVMEQTGRNAAGLLFLFSFSFIMGFLSTIASLFSCLTPPVLSRAHARPRILHFCAFFHETTPSQFNKLIISGLSWCSFAKKTTPG